MRCAAVLLSIAATTAGPAAAAPPSRHLRMTQTDSTSLELAGGRGARNWDEDIEVTVELRADHTLVAAIHGTRRSSDLIVTEATDYTLGDDTAWTTAWTGSWRARGDDLVLDLARGAATCTHVETTSSGSAEQPCRGAAPLAHLICASTTIELEQGHRVAAWSCTTAVDEALGESPPWLLGKTRCIEVHKPHVGRPSFKACSAATSPATSPGSAATP